LGQDEPERAEGQLPGTAADHTESGDWSDSILNDYTVSGEITSEAGLYELLTLRRPSTFIYRGQPERFDKLQPTIERLGGPRSNLFAMERYIRSEFMRRAPHYLTRLPEKGDALAWLALARQHGAPCRWRRKRGPVWR
jgi:hypothetical protein